MVRNLKSMVKTPEKPNSGYDFTCLCNKWVASLGSQQNWLFAVVWHGESFFFGGHRYSQQRTAGLMNEKHRVMNFKSPLLAQKLSWRQIHWKGQLTKRSMQWHSLIRIYIYIYIILSICNKQTCNKIVCIIN